MKILLMTALIILQGCAAIMPGRADYVIKPILNEAGKVIAYEAEINTSQDVGLIEIDLKVNEKGAINFRLLKKDVSSSAPAAVAADTTRQAIEALTTALDKLP